MRLSKKSISKQTEIEVESLLKELLKSDNGNHAFAMVKTILSSTEYQAVLRRLGIMTALKEGQSYSQIETTFEVSAATIASVHTRLSEKNSKILANRALVYKKALALDGKLKHVINKLFNR